MTSAVIYARVSSARQKQDETINSQTAALRAHAQQQGLEVPPEWVFEDDGHSGATLVRPALERLRDLIAQVPVEVVLCYSPDRLARKFAYQALLVEEFTRAGTRVEFVKGPRGDSPEDQLLVQFQGMFAEYEKAQILERSRRGKTHRAKAGSINVLSGAPFGYRYLRKSEHTGAGYEIIEHEAVLVAELFRRYADEAATLAQLARWLTDQAVPTRTGKHRWDRSVVWGMLRNPAYAGQAVFGKTMVINESPGRNRVARLAGRSTPKASKTVDRPSQEWIGIPVPAIVSQDTFDRVGARLADNKRFASRNSKTPSLLQGLSACSACGYAYYRTSTRTTAKTIYYYRCLGSDDYRHENGRVCANKPVRADYLDQVVWDHITCLLADPVLIRDEIDRRLDQARTSDPATSARQRLELSQAKNSTAITRMIEAFSEQLITIDELRARMPELRGRETNLRNQINAMDTQLADREVYLKLADDLDGFLTQLRGTADTTSVAQRQHLLRLLVKDILIGSDTITIRHRIPIRERATPSDQNHDDDATEGDHHRSYPLRWGRDNPTLRSSRNRLGNDPIGQHTRTQPQPDQLEHPPVTDTPFDFDHESFLVDRAEEILNVGLEDNLPPSRERHPDHLQRISSTALGAEPKTTVQEVSLENWFKNQLRRLLRHPVTHSRNTQRPLTAIRFRNLHPTHRRRAVPVFAKITGQLAEHPPDPVILNIDQGHTINPSRSAISSHPFPRLPQNVTSVDAVIQGMETPTLRLLCRSP
ncbi:MAG: recombinase family protein [Candidatus Nanopelagicales bacterium]|nr:recombinase family protein [Candidatus Nanopelagicales bacterium]